MIISLDVRFIIIHTHTKVKKIGKHKLLKYEIII